MDRKTNRSTRNTRRKSKNKFNKEQKLIYFGISLFLLSLFLILFMILPWTGFLGKFINSFLKGSFGMLGRIFPFLILYISIVFLFAALRSDRRRLIIPVVMIFAALLIVFDVLHVKTGDISIHYQNTIEVAIKFRGGGVIGMLLSHLIRAIGGSFGAYLFAVIVIVSAIFLSLKVEKKDVIEGTQVITTKIEKSIKTGMIKMKSKEKARIVKNPNKALEIDEKKPEVVDIDIEFDDYNTKTAPPVESNINNDNLSNKANDLPLYTKKIKQKGSEDIEQFSILKEDEKIGDKYVFPPVELLKIPSGKTAVNKSTIQKKARIIEDTLRSFGIEASVESINRGPTITCYELKPATGVKISRIVGLSDDLSMALESKDIRIVAPIPGKNRVGIETPNDEKETLYLREIIESNEFKSCQDELPMALGKDITGKTIVSTISKMPHLLIAGATGSGKSVCINSLIVSILYKSSPDEVKLILIDPKVVELSIYNDIPHLMIPVVTDPKKASTALDWAVTEMERRYGLFAKRGARDFKSYNEKIKNGEGAEGEEVLKKIVIIIDELADLMMVAGKEVEESIARLAQMARAAGIHLIVATQRPSVDVITGTIKANIPSRISFAVSSQIDSRTILDMSGAEKLLGMGDMLFLPSGQSSPIRIQGTFVSDKEIENIVDYIKLNNKKHEYEEEVEEQLNTNSTIADNSDFFDELFDDAVLLVVKDNQGSISYLQRRLKVGYSRAARMIDRMEELGIVGPSEGSKPRKVLIGLDEIDEILYGKKEVMEDGI
ncbi:MAG: DNA translocase FtsK [Ezakiella sp.]|nr:DNA translocase FtsK [Ezakiella sp.]